MTQLNDIPVLAGLLLPHPPVLIPGIERGRMEAGATFDAMVKAAAVLKSRVPETIVLISPHAPLYRDAVWLAGGTALSGDFARFGARQIGLRFEADEDLRQAFLSELEAENLPCLSPAESMTPLDHGALVPLWFLRQAANFRLLLLSAPLLPDADLKRVGIAIARAAQRTGRRIVLVASGDQSHMVNDRSPYGSRPEGQRHDQLLMDALIAGDLSAAAADTAALAEPAAVCGHQALAVLSGAWADLPVTIPMAHYEAPYGIGYATAVFLPPESAPVRLARQAITTWVNDQCQLRAEPDFAPEQEPAGVFVSLHQAGELRGCIGTISATQQTLADEIINNAISAATQDPRFDPVSADEIDSLEITVDVLSPAEPATRDQLDPRLYGVIVSLGIRRGLLLPALEGVDDVEAQLAIACRKAGIDPHSDFSISRFRVVRYY